MKVSYGEGLTSHSGPASCGGGGNVVAEALAGGTRAELLSLESLLSGCLRRGQVRGATSARPLLVRTCRTLRGRRPRARVQAFYTGTGRSWIWQTDGWSVREENSMEALPR